MTGSAYIGISGWRYPPWRGVFYPKGLQQRLELQFASRQLSSIEINGSFYSLQRPSSYLAWRDETPDDFVFSVKGGRYITHLLSLRNVETALANFWASGVLALREKLGPILWQLPERHPFDADQLEAFFALLPRSTDRAATIGKEHEERMEGRTWLEPAPDRRLRHALEVRHASFLSPGVLDVLRRNDISIVVADTAGKWPLIREVTATDFVYVRLHGDKELYVSGYTDEALDRWAADIRGWLDGTGTPDGAPRDVYVYFDNDVKVHAPFDAIALRGRLT